MSNREQSAARPANAFWSSEHGVSVLSNGTYEVALGPNGAVMFRRLVPPLLSGRLIRQEEYELDREVFLGPSGYAVVDLRWTAGDEPSPEAFSAIVGEFEYSLSGWESWPAVRPGPWSELDVSPIASANLASS